MCKNINKCSIQSDVIFRFACRHFSTQHSDPAFIKTGVKSGTKKIDGKLMRNMLIIANVDSKLVSVIGHQIVGNM